MQPLVTDSAVARAAKCVDCVARKTVAYGGFATLIHCQNPGSVSTAYGLVWSP